MSLSLSRFRLTAFGGLCLVLLAGCSGNKTVPVSGKLILPTKAKFADTDSIVVTFISEGGQNASNTANAKDLTFTVNAAPGQYKISVAIQPYAGSKDGEARGKEITRHLGAIATTDTPLRYEVTADPNQSITIDLSKSTVSKN